MDKRPYGSHNRARTRDLKATYTNPLKRYLSAVGRDYVRSNKVLRYKLPSDSIKSHGQARVLTRKFTYMGYDLTHQKVYKNSHF